MNAPDKTKLEGFAFDLVGLCADNWSAVNELLISFRSSMRIPPDGRFRSTIFWTPATQRTIIILGERDRRSANFLAELFDHHRRAKSETPVFAVQVLGQVAWLGWMAPWRVVTPRSSPIDRIELPHSVPST